MIADFLKRAGLAAPLEYLGQTVHGLAHPSLLRSGATTSERTKPLPGDDLIVNPSCSFTRCVTIQTPCERVWPWLLQMGHARGGWYGWYPVNLPHDQSSWIIIPEYQCLSVGDVMLDGPGCSSDRGAVTVTQLIQGKAIVLRSCRDMFSGQEIRGDSECANRYADMTWAFVLEALADNSSRLLVRTRIAYSASWLALPVVLVFGPGDTVMQRSLIFGIKHRAELITDRGGLLAVNRVS